jgi:threonine dehydratase
MQDSRLVAGLPSERDIVAAAELLGRYLPRTPLVPADGLHAGLHLKLEQELPTGSFKVRGALVALHRAVQDGDVAHVTAASTGNHGAAVAWAARTLGVPATIFLPENPNPVKRSRIAEHGARVVESGPDIAAARVGAEAFAQERGALLLDDATDPHLPAGPATIGAEIMLQLPGTATVIVPVGDTALIRGVAAAVKRVNGATRVVGVQAATAPSYALAWRTGNAVPTADCVTIADGLATRVPEPANVAAIRQVVDDVVLVTDDAMLAAMRRLLRTEGIHAEPSAAASLAALDEIGLATSPVVAIITGGNTPAHVLARVLELS